MVTGLYTTYSAGNDTQGDNGPAQGVMDTIMGQTMDMLNELEQPEDRTEDSVILLAQAQHDIHDTDLSVIARADASDSGEL